MKKARTTSLAVAASVANARLSLHPAASSQDDMASWGSALSRQQMFDLIAYVRRMT
jgi:hypothetical protein